MIEHYDPGPDRTGVTQKEILKIGGGASISALDDLAIEEPLEIRIEYGPRSSRVKRSLSITMRTPGFDFELAAGFLFTEGILRSADDIEEIKYCGPNLTEEPLTHVVRVVLAPDVMVDMERLSRHFYTSSSCGVCGKSSIEALKTQSHFKIQRQDIQFDAGRIHQLSELLRKSQGIFDRTGGLHASALFSNQGEALIVREDVGRHNALDKLIGYAVIHKYLPLDRYLLLVSGRVSFEVVQKAHMAGIPVIAAVGAPSSLAVELAEESGMTLLGFVRDGRFNIYCHGSRIRVG